MSWLPCLIREAGRVDTSALSMPDAHAACRVDTKVLATLRFVGNHG